MLAASPNVLMADGAHLSQITVTARDAYGNSVANAAVNLTASGGNTTFYAASGTTNANGIYTTTLSSTQTQTQTLTATFANEQSISTSLVCVVGPVSSAKSTFTVTPSSQVADNNQVIVGTATARDAAGNLIAGQSAHFTASGGVTVSPSVATTNAAGQCTASFKSAVTKQQASASVIIGGYLFSRYVNFVPGPPTATTSTFVANPNTVAADGNSTSVLQLTVRDAQSNVIPTDMVSFTSPGTNTLLGSASSATDANGLVQTTFTSSTAQTTTVSASLGNAQTATVTVQFTAPTLVSAATSRLTISPTQQTADGNHVLSMTAHLADSAGNAVSGQQVVFSATTPTVSLSQTALTTVSSGNANINVASAYAGPTTFYARAQNITLSANANFLVRSGYCPSGTNPNYILTAATSVGSGATAFVAADFDRNGTLDLAVATLQGGSEAVMVFAGKGNGMFQPPVTYAVDSNCTAPQALAVGDLNMDGFPDILVGCNKAGASLAVLLNSATGFGPASLYSAGYTYGLALADFNADGRLDVAAVDRVAQTLQVFPGRANGSLGTYVSYNIGALVDSIGYGDFNRDGKIDVILASSNAGAIYTMNGTSMNTFSSATSTSAPFPFGPLSVADTKERGAADVFLFGSDVNRNYVNILLNDGSGVFDQSVSYSPCGPSTAATVGDFNGDGHIDVFVTQNNGVGCFVLGDGSGYFTHNYTTGMLGPAASLLTGDFDNDGKQDIGILQASSFALLLNTDCS
jgi:hypothetical protein